MSAVASLADRLAKIEQEATERYPDETTPAASGTPKLLTWAAMQVYPALKYLVEDLLPVGGVSLLVGHPKAGKSTLARVLAAEVAGHGVGSFLGRKVNGAPGAVAYYSPDEHPTMTAEHFRGILPSDDDHIDFVQGRATLDELAKLLGRGLTTKHPYRLLIVDTLGRLFQGEQGLESDSYMAWQSHLDGVRQLATFTKCHVCLLHHARKSGGDRSLAVLGSGAIAGSADTVISVTVSEEDGAWVRRVESTNRAGVELPRQRLALAGDGWLTVSPMTEAKADPKADAMAEARAMKRDGLSIRAIAEQLGVSRGTAFNWTK